MKWDLTCWCVFINENILHLPWLRSLPKKIFGTKHKPTILQSFRFGCGKSGGVWRYAMDSHFASSWLKSLSNKLESLAEWSWVAERNLVWSFIGWYGTKVNRVDTIKKGLTLWGSCLEEPSKNSIRWFSDLTPKSWPINSLPQDIVIEHFEFATWDNVLS